MRSIPFHLEWQGPEDWQLGPSQLLTVRELYEAIGSSPGWVYKRTKKGTVDPLSIRGIRFDPFTLESAEGIAGVNENGKYKLTRKRFQTGSVQLREYRDPAYW